MVGIGLWGTALSDSLQRMSKAKVSVLVVVGTRPEAIKLVPLILALRESEIFRPLVVSTGQHHQMVSEVLDLAGIKPDYDLWVGGARSQLNDRIREVVGRLDDFCREEFKADGRPRRGGSVFDGHFPMAVWCTATRHRPWPRPWPLFTCGSRSYTSKPASGAATASRRSRRR